jgi:glutaredoxin
MSLKASCPKLDDLIQTYYDLGDPAHSIQLDQVEATLEQCLAQERLDRDDPYPTETRVTLQVSNMSVFEGGDHLDADQDYLDQFDGFIGHLEPHYVSDSTPANQGTPYSDMDSFDSDLDTVKPIYLTKTNPNMYYVYVKREPCPYLANTRNMLVHLSHEERPFTDDNVGAHALKSHANILHLEAEKGRLSSPQIFHGDTFIPGGSEGLFKYISKKTKVKKVNKVASFVAPTFKPIFKPTPQNHTTWFIYGSIKCRYCKQAIRILGDHATFIELYTYKPDVKAKPFPRIHPAHAKLVGPERAIEIRDEIVNLRDTEGVPIMYHKAEWVPNNFKKLRQRV